MRGLPYINNRRNHTHAKGEGRGLARPVGHQAGVEVAVLALKKPSLETRESAPNLRDEAHGARLHWRCDAWHNAALDKSVMPISVFALLKVWNIVVA